MKNFVHNFVFHTSLPNNPKKLSKPLKNVFKLNLLTTWYIVFCVMFIFSLLQRKCGPICMKHVSGRLET